MKIEYTLVWALLSSIVCVGATTCASGKGVLSPDGKACCDTKCGSCGGAGCDKRSGFIGSSANSCCEGNIVAANKACGTPPCVVKSTTSSLCRQIDWTCSADRKCCAGLTCRADGYCKKPSAPTPSPPTTCRQLDWICSADKKCCSGLFCRSDGYCKKPTTTTKPSTSKPTTSKPSPGTPDLFDCGINGTNCGFLAKGASPTYNLGTKCCASGQSCYLDPLNLTGPTICAAEKDRYVCEIVGPKIISVPCGYAFDKDSSLISQPTKCCSLATQGCYLNASATYLDCLPKKCSAAGTTECGYTYTTWWTGSGDSWYPGVPTTCCSSKQVCGPEKSNPFKYVCSDFSCPTGEIACGAVTYEGSPGWPDNICCAKGQSCTSSGSAHGSSSYCIS